MQQEEKQKILERIERKLQFMPDFIRRYVEYKQADDRARPNTILSYLYDYERFLTWLIEEEYFRGDIRDIPLSLLERLTQKDIDRYLLFLQRYSNITKRTSRNRMLSSLKSLFHFLSQIEEDENGFPLLKKNIMAKIEIKSLKPSPKAQADALKGRVFRKKEEIQAFLDFVAFEFPKKIKDSLLADPVKKRLLHYYSLNIERDLAFLSLILGSGLRVGEAVSLDTDDIDWVERAVKVIRKGKETETFVHFSETAKDFLESYLSIRDQRYKPGNKEKALFLSLSTGPNGKVSRLTKRAAQAMVLKYTKWYGRPLSVHNLRHSFATVHYGENKDLFALQAQLGHADPRTTQRYALIFDDTLREMVDKTDE